MAIKAAFFDVDGTLTTERVWKGMLEYYKQRGLRRWTHRLFWVYHMPIYLLYKTKLVSQSAFRKPWAAHLAWFVHGYTVEQAQVIWDWVAQEYLSPFWRNDALYLIKKHKAEGDLVVLVSAGPTPLEEAIATRVGADFAVGTDFLVKDGRYTGGVAGRVCLDEQKAELTKKALVERGVQVDFAESLAYADGGTDIHMLEMVGNPVAFHPDDELLPIAHKRGWKIVE
jgi:HAD superfamily hydrolase (TIGR01490 family)